MSGEELLCRLERAFGEKPYKAIDYTTLGEAQDNAQEEGIEPGSDEYDGYIDTEKDFTFSQFSAVNEQIEKFLYKIDQDHGTHYCPSGATRL